MVNILNTTLNVFMQCMYHIFSATFSRKNLERVYSPLQSNSCYSPSLLHHPSTLLHHPTSLLTLEGIITGASFHLWSHDSIDNRIAIAVQKLTAFDTSLFFILLLPPIVFDSAYNAHKQAFFENFVLIWVLALVGTYLSAVVIGEIVYQFGTNPALNVFAFSRYESLVFGSLIGATDPVTVIAVFSHLGVHPMLFALVFGESVLNDVSEGK